MKSLLSSAFVIVAVATLCAVQRFDARTDESPSEARAIEMMRALNTAEVGYQGAYPQMGFACTLNQLRKSDSGEITSNAAGFISGEIASGYVEGYQLAVNCGTDDSKPYSRVSIYATPVKQTTGARAFCSELYLVGGKILGGLISFASDGKVQSCFVRGTLLK